ncbi:MAG: hypothetical protein A3D31_07740 [Candidatus Fluviicola riflensis]|nr:MAG: hypothetical protein CHH17_07270 [Candidatus Fluviicola riflensis]OGS79835.1 MAG: hypothetical protein A3D31_07740 [Candidatus Fluviicola riflensis]OGS82350.1 MAG: hypothetical protein A2724_16685 [Fluviicola sp. RIFCSPHIGHO2_01_FULL_43_53]OGS88014.1 MAG: hypothetical protein A3E30_14120 [Fluviicola sp. RIFCSPHIGHO2_12_FULL_43_24]
MGKIYFLSALAIGTTFNLLAQPTLTSAGLNPIAGEEFTVYNSNWVDPGASGSNVTFDLSGLAETDTTYVVYTNGNASYPGSNLTASFITFSDTNNFYMNASASGLSLVGMLGSGGTSYLYQDGKEVNEYPLMYNSTNSDYFHATFTVLADWEQYGTITAEADAYGTLITPEGTFTDVIRVHYIQNFTDSCSFAVIDYLSDYYVWYKEGYHRELATVNYQTTPQGGFTQYATYLEAGNLGLNEEEKSSLFVYPNPAIDAATVRLKANETLKTLNLTDMNGRAIEVSYTNEANHVSLDLRNLDAGLYLVELQYESGEIGLGKIEVK